MKERTFSGVLLAVLVIAVPAEATTLRVMKQGLGTASITSAPAAINCPPTCVVSTYTGTETVVLNLSTTTGFREWSGDCSGTGPCSVTMNTDRAVHAWFDPVPALLRLTMADLLPDPVTGRLQRLSDYLVAHPEVDTASEFLHVLPDEFKWNWILMSRSESLQTGTADMPRILLPSVNGQLVFTFGVHRGNRVQDGLQSLDVDRQRSRPLLHRAVDAPAPGRDDRRHHARERRSDRRRALLILLLILFLILVLLAVRAKRYRLLWLLLAIVVAIAAIFIFQRDRNNPLSTRSPA